MGMGILWIISIKLSKSYASYVSVFKSWHDFTCCYIVSLVMVAPNNVLLYTLLMIDYFSDDQYFQNLNFS